MKTRTQGILGASIASLVVATLAFGSVAFASTAYLPITERLTDTNGVPISDGSHTVSFTVNTDGSPSCTESSSVTTKAGVYSYLLGSAGCSATLTSMDTANHSYTIARTYDGDGTTTTTDTYYPVLSARLAEGLTASGVAQVASSLGASLNGYVKTSGDTMYGSLKIAIPTTTGDSNLTITSSGSSTPRQAYIDLQNNNVERWLFGKNSTAEGGSNAGSDFVLNRYNDAGTLLGTPIKILRSNGYVGIGDISPSYLLDVNGAGRVNGTFYATSYVRNGVAENAANGIPVLDAGGKILISQMPFKKGQLIGNSGALRDDTISDNTNYFSFSNDGTNKVDYAQFAQVVKNGSKFGPGLSVVGTLAVPTGAMTNTTANNYTTENFSNDSLFGDNGFGAYDLWGGICVRFYGYSGVGGNGYATKGIKAIFADCSTDQNYMFNATNYTQKIVSFVNKNGTYNNGAKTYTSDAGNYGLATVPTCFANTGKDWANVSFSGYGVKRVDANNVVVIINNHLNCPISMAFKLTNTKTITTYTLATAIALPNAVAISPAKWSYQNYNTSYDAGNGPHYVYQQWNAYIY